MGSTASLPQGAARLATAGAGWDAWRAAWENRLVDALPLPAAVVGVAMGAGIAAIYLAVESVFGRPFADEAVGGFAGITPTAGGFLAAAFLTGYAVWAGYAINVGNAQTRERLRPSLPDLESGTPGISLRASRLFGVVGAISGIGFIVVVDQPALDVVTGRAFSTDGLLSLVVVPLPFWLFSRAAYFTLAGVTSVSERAEQGLRLDLLDPSAVAPIGRMALRASLLWIGAAVLGGISLVASGSPAEYVALGFLLTVAAASFLLPVRGVRRRIRRAKLEELARTRAELHRAREGVATGGEDAASAAARLPGLVAWEARIEAVREWPFDTPTLVRFALFLLIPLGSWLGGALVERSVDLFLD